MNSIKTNKLNIVRPICANLVGKDHGFHHRAVVGVCIMLFGVVIAKTIGHNEQEVIAVLGDTLGYGLHGMGLIPFVEALVEEV
jgi:hypothetical protein